MKTVHVDELLKSNAIALVKDHKKHCDHESCGISTYMIAQLLTKAGISMTKEELAEFV